MSADPYDLIAEARQRLTAEGCACDDLFALEITLARNGGRARIEYDERFRVHPLRAPGCWRSGPNPWLKTLVRQCLRAVDADAKHAADQQAAKEARP
jgi:hypothetical protein